MAQYTTQDIRNIALAGQAGAGKTSLVEALLYRAGVVGAPGSVEKGDTVSDSDPLERRHHHSLSTAVISLDHKGRHINLVDTPGYPDFLGQTLSALPAVETVAVVVNAQSGIEPMTRRAMEWAAAQRLCRMIIVNRIDAEPERLGDLLEQLRETFGNECLPLNLPAERATRVIDCLTHEEGTADFWSVAEMHTALLDQVIEVDETLVETYLETGTVAPEQLHASFEQALREGHIVPVCFASARTGAGVAELLQWLVELAPNPLEGGPHTFVRANGEVTERLQPLPDPDKPALARVFKVELDPFAGKLGVFRLHQGTVRKGEQLLIDEGATAFKVAHLFRLRGKEHEEIDECMAGDICAVSRVEELHYDAMLHGGHEDDGVHPEPLPLPQPLVGLALEPKSRGDQQKVSEVLNKLTAEDPCLHVEHDAASHETVLRGLGEFHLRVALEKMQERYNVHVDTHPPSVPYRETVTRRAQGHYRHKKQTGGAGQFAEVFMEVEPREPGAGFEFVDRVVGGAIPGQFIPAVEKGVRQVLESGAIAGFPVQDVRAIVYDGKHHPVDSKEIAFVIAGRKAFLDAIAKAAPVVLEPFVNLDVSVPESSIGDITGDLSSRRGRVNQTERLPGGQVLITAQAPLAELTDYASRLKSLTGGEGTYTLALSHYEPAPPGVQRELMGRYRPSQ